MSLEKLINRINSEEIKLRSSVLNETQKELTQLEKDFNLKLKKEIDQKWSEIKLKEKNFTDQVNTNLELEKRAKVLALKQNTINSLFSKLSENFNKLDRKEYREWIINRVNNLKLQKPGGKLHIGKIASFDIDKSFVSSIEETLKDMNLKSIEVFFDKNLGEGFVYKEGNIEIDAQLTTLIEELKKEENIKISKMLFTTKD
ncbi:hypothetical protein ACFL4A_01020 [bacterium]